MSHKNFRKVISQERHIIILLSDARFILKHYSDSVEVDGVISVFEVGNSLFSGRRIVQFIRTKILYKLYTILVIFAILWCPYNVMELISHILNEHESNFGKISNIF